MESPAITQEHSVGGDLSVIQVDELTAQMQAMKIQIESLQTTIASLETSNAALKDQLSKENVYFEYLTKQAVDAKIERDEALLQLESAREDVDFYMTKVHILEKELRATSKHGELAYQEDLFRLVAFQKSELKAAKVLRDYEDCPSLEKLDDDARLQALKQEIEHKLEATVCVHELRRAHELEKKRRAKMEIELAKLKAEAHMDKQSPFSSRISELENMLDTSSKTIESMASQLSEVEEREKVDGGNGRWKQVQTLAEAKNVINYLFNVTSTSRCQIRESKRQTEWESEHQNESESI